MPSPSDPTPEAEAEAPAGPPASIAGPGCAAGAVVGPAAPGGVPDASGLQPPPSAAGLGPAAPGGVPGVVEPARSPVAGAGPVVSGGVGDGAVAVPSGEPFAVRPARWSVPVPGTRVRLGLGLLGSVLAATAWAIWASVAGVAGEDDLVPQVGGAAVAVTVVASVLLHEGAHALAARALGYHLDWVVVGLFDGKTSYSGRTDRPLDRAAIAMAGPAASAAVVLALLAVWATGRAGPAEAVLVGVWFNVATFALNLLPIGGSDGWCVLTGLIEDRRRRRGRPKRSRRRGEPAAQ